MTTSSGASSLTPNGLVLDLVPPEPELSLEPPPAHASRMVPAGSARRLAAAARRSTVRRVRSEVVIAISLIRRGEVDRGYLVQGLLVFGGPMAADRPRGGLERRMRFVVGALRDRDVEQVEDDQLGMPPGQRVRPEGGG